MRFRKKKETISARQPQIQPRQNSNIMRYYRPEHTEPIERRIGVKKRIGDDDSSNMNKLSHYLSTGIQWFVVVVIVLLLIVNISLSGTAVRIKGSDYQYRSLDEYQSITDKILSRQLAYHSKVTLSSERIESEIRSEIPEAEDVVAVVPLAGRRLQIILHIAQPLIRLQRPEANTQAVISKAGIVTHEASTESIVAGFSSLPIISIIGVDAKIGTQILTQAETDLVSLILEELDGTDAFRPKVSSIEFDILKREMNIRFHDATFYAKLTPERESRTQVGALVKTLRYLAEQGSTPQEYVDVRVDDRVYVK